VPLVITNKDPFLDSLQDSTSPPQVKSVPFYTLAEGIMFSVGSIEEEDRWSYGEI